MSVNKCQENDEGRKSPFATISTIRFRPDLAMDAKTTGGNCWETSRIRIYLLKN